jgi:uncharacterized protein (TIGR02246 family)
MSKPHGVRFISAWVTRYCAVKTNGRCRRVNVRSTERPTHTQQRKEIDVMEDASMKQKNRLLCLSLIICCLACAPPEEAIVTYDTAADEEILRTMIARHVEAFSAGDLETIMAMYATDIVQMPPDTSTITGDLALRDLLQVFLEHNTLELTANVQDIRVSGDLAYTLAAYEQTVTHGADGEPLSETGNWVLISQRESGGEWKIVSEIWNTDHPIGDDE